MRRLTVACVALLGIVVGLARGDSALPVKTLTDIKDATVFIRVEKDKVAAASGSGFVVHVLGDTAWVATNHHVVHLTTLVERKVPYIAPRQPPKITPGVPIRPVGPNIQYRTETVEVAVPAPNLTLVFGSGTKNERSLKAEVVSTDAEADLAVVKVTGLKDPPKPINLKSPELVETMPVFMFGFPLGKILSLDKGNPAITVGRGSVSSIRMIKGEVGAVQLDGDINPGNSGGPVVDEKGQLVGVVVARIRNTKIGLAIPTQELQRVLAGRVQEPKLVPTKADDKGVEVEVEVGLLDPLEKIKSIALHYAPTRAVTEQVKKNGLAKLAEAKKLDLKRAQQKALGKFIVSAPEKGELDITCQVSYVQADGKTVLGELKPGGLKAPAQVAAKDPAAKESAPAGQPPKGWQEQTSADKSFSVWMPEGGRRRTSERTLTVRGVQLKLNSVLAEPPGGPVYGAAALTLPPVLAQKLAPSERIEAIRDVFAVESKGKVSNETEIKRGTLSGKEYRIDGARLSLRLLLYSVDDRIYQAVVSGTPAQVEGGNATAFLASYRVLGNAAPASKPPSTDPFKPPPVTKVEEKFDGASLAVTLKPSKPGDRGAIVGATLQALQRKALAGNDLAQIIADLQTPERAKAAIDKLHNTQADPKRQAEVARLIEKWAAKSDWDVFARASACTALRWWGTPESVKVLVALTKDTNPHSIHFRHPAMWSMAYLGGNEAVEAIAARIEDFIDRGGVVKILQQMGSVSEAQTLKLLDHKAPEIRVEAAKILKVVGTKDSAGPLLKVAEQDANANVRKVAQEALQSIAGRQEKK
jgi:S1-C subfamily serine protease/HEAT repeat protein